MTGRSFREPLALALVGAVLLGCDGSLDPLEALPRPSVVRPSEAGIYVVEPFDYHYPDEAFFDPISDAVEIVAARGQTEVGAFVYVPQQAGEVRLESAELVSSAGDVLPASNLHLGVVTFADRTREVGGIDGANRLSMAYSSGARRGGATGDFRGYNQDARERLPLVPLVIAPDAIELAERQLDATGFISLGDVPYARAAASPGRAVEFWVSVSVPVELSLSAPEVRFEAALSLATPDGPKNVSVSVTALDFELDTLEAHQRFVGVTDGLTHNAAEFREAIVDDLRDHGANLLRDDFDLADYQDLTERGLVMLVNSDSSFDPVDIPRIAQTGARPLFTVGLFEPTEQQLTDAISKGTALRAAGAELESEMTLDVARTMQAQLGMDMWTYALTTYELSDLHAGEFDEFLRLLDVMRADASAKEIPLSGHYAEVFNGHVPHQARLLYGLWLDQSNLDFGMAYGYAMVDGQNPFTTTTYSGVAFPAELTSADGTTRRIMLPSVTWEAFRAGIDDFRYALTARRLTQDNAELSTRLAELLAPYGPLYDASGNRVDFRNREADLRRTRAALTQLIFDAK